MKINEKQILKVSRLARLELTDDEKIEFSQQLSEIISYVEKISELDTDSVKPSDHIVDQKNIFRADSIKKSIETSEIENMAPDFKNSHFVVPKIIEG